MNNTNTSTFWNKKNKEVEKQLLSSTIYRIKNKVVISWLPRHRINLLNLGIGNGYLEKTLKMYRKNAKLHGIDISDKSIRNLNKLGYGIYKVSNITRIPFQDNYFDCITALDILEHLTNKELNKALDEINRVLKSGGILIISVPLNESVRDARRNRHIIKFEESSFIDLLRLNFKKINIVRLVAFGNLFFVKSFFNSIFKMRKPNLLLVRFLKK